MATRYAAYERDGTSCVTVNYRGDTPEDLAQMQTALQAWVSKGPKGAASVSRDDVTLVFTSCDPGKKAAKVASGKSMDALTLALTRTYLSLELVKGGMEPSRPRAAARTGWSASSPSPSSTTRRSTRAGAPDGRAVSAGGLGRPTGRRTFHAQLLVYSRPMRHNGRTTT